MADPIESLPIPTKDVMELAVAEPDFAGQEWAEVIQDGNSRRHLVARKHSPEFTGNPLAPTPDLGDNSESIATTEYVQNELDNLNITLDAPGEPTALTLNTHTTLDQDGKVAIFVVLDWDDPVPVKPAWTYEVRYTSDGANPDSRFVGEPGAKIRVESGVAYIFKVRTLSKDAKSDWVLFDPITPLKKMIAPPAPTGLARVNGHRWVRLSWDNPLVANPTFYDYWKTIIYRSDTNNFANAVEVGRIDGTRYTDNDGLENGQNYFYWITHLDTSRNESAKHPLSNTAGVQATPRRINDDDTDDTQPGVPTSLVLTPRTTLTDDGRIMLDLIATWSPPSGGLSAKGSYVIWIKDLTTNDVTTQETDRDDRSVTFRVKSSRSYDVKVRAKLGVGQAGNWCSVVTAVMDKKTSYVVVPSGLTATGYHRRVVLNWDEITGVDILDYKHTRIYRATTNNFAAATIVGRPDGTEFVDAGLANNQTYYYWIAHVDTTKNVSVRYPLGPATNNGIAATTTPIVDADADATVPSVPTSLAVTFGSLEVDEDGKVVAYAYASWTQPSTPVPVAYYRVKVTQNSNGEVRTFETIDLNKTFKVKTGKQYDVQVRAVSIFERVSALTSIVSYTRPKKSALPNPPTSVSLVLKPKGTWVKWVAPADKDVTSYNIYVGTTSTAGSAALTGSVNATRYLDQEERTIGTPYYYFVTSVDSSGNESSTRVAASNNPQTYRGTDSTDISAGAVVAASMGVGTNANLLPNSDQQAGLGNWGYEWSSDTAQFTLTLRTDTYAPHPGAIEIRQITGTDSQEYGVGPKNADGTTQYYSVIGDQWYELSTYYYGHRCDGVQPYIRWEDSAGTLISHSTPGTYTAFQDGDPGKALKNYLRTPFTKFQAPTNAVRATVFFRQKGTRQGFSYTDCYLWLHKMYFNICRANQSESTPWSPATPNLLANANFGAGTVSDDKVIQTPPTTPNTLAVTFGSIEVDEDGKAVAYAYASWLQPSTAIPVAYYRIKVTQNSNGEVRMFETPNLSLPFEVKTGKQYDVQVCAISIFEKASALTSIVSYTRPKKSALPNPPTSVSIVQKANGNVIKWVAPTDKDIAYYNIYVGTTSTAGSATLTGTTDGTRYGDHEVRTVGTPYYYFVTSVDRSGNESSTRVAASNNPQTYRQVITTEMEDNAAIPSKVYNSNGSNLVRDFDLVDTSLWLAEDDLSVDLTVNRVLNPAATTDRGPSKYALWVASPGRASCYMGTKEDIFVEESKEYWISMFVGPHVLGDGFEQTLYVQWFKHNGSGGLTQIGTDVTVDTNLNADITQMSGFVTAPAKAARMRMFANCVTLGDGSGMEITSPTVKERINSARIVDAAVTTNKIAVNSVTVIEKSNPAGGVTVTASTTADVVTNTSNHTANADAVEIKAEFRNNSGGQRTVDIIWRAGSTDLRTITGVVLQDGQMWSGVYLDAAPSGASTDYKVRVTAGGVNATFNERQMVTTAFKR